MSNTAYKKSLEEALNESWFDLKGNAKNIIGIEINDPPTPADATALLNTVGNIGKIMQYYYPEYGKLLICASIGVANCRMDKDKLPEVRFALDQCCAVLEAVLKEDQSPN